MKLGLVLAGGGGKGSYEIGVWKYLKEIGLDKKISVISGTSVGGLNAALMGSVDYNTAEYVWKNEIEGKILDTVSKSRKNLALFSRTGLIKIIDGYVPLENIKTSKKHIYVTCFNINKVMPVAFRLNDYDVLDMKTLLCATSAIPVAFQNELISNNLYIDGGVSDNVPLRPLLEEGCTHALIVNLNRDYIDYSGFEIKTVAIHPTINLGGVFSGMLDFSLTNSEKRIKIGYDDCRNKYLFQINSLWEKKLKNVKIDMTDEINSMNDNKILLNTLKLISVDSSLIGKIQHNMDNINIPLKTFGGPVCWKVVAEYNDWKFQRNKFTKHIRLIDPLKNRQLWGDYDKMVGVCRDFLISEIE